MAGPNPAGTSTPFWLNQNLSANGTLSYEFDTGQCYFGQLLVYQKTGGTTTLSVFGKNEPTSSGGTLVDNAMSSISLAHEWNKISGLSMFLEPATYQIKLVSGGGTAVVDGYKRLST